MGQDARRERFLGVLAELGGTAGNGKLKLALGWQDDTYARVQAALIEAGHITKGRGRGGSVSLAVPMVTPPAAPAPRPTPQPATPKSAAPARATNGSGFEQIFKAIDDVLWKEAGCTTELDYTEQTSWMLFLK